MKNNYANHWHSLRRHWTLRSAVVISASVHVAAFAALNQNFTTPPPRPIPISYEVKFLQPTPPDPKPEAKPVEAPKPPPPPPPPPKPEPKPKPKVAKKPDPKPDPPKKPEPKPKPPEKKKPDPPKPKPKVVAKAPPEPPKPQPEVVAEAPPAQTGIQSQSLPPMLNAWGRLVQRKVETFWRIPGGITLNEDNREVHIAFWVGRDGMLQGNPEVVKAAAEASLAQAGIQAIISAQPLPPLPPEFRGSRQQVVYVFSLID